jgi:hypothetical protein
MPIARLVVVFGQSNAISFGTFSRPFPDRWAVDQGIQIWNGTNFVTYVPCVTSSPYGAYWGVEAQYARLCRESDPAIPVYIVKRAYNNTGTAFRADPTMQDWSPFSVGKQWDALFNDINMASAATLQAGFQAMVEPFLWVGNETDAMNEEDALACQSNTEWVFRALRSGLFNCSQTRAIVARCHPNPALLHLNTVRNAQRTGPWDWIDTDDLDTAEDDPGHYSAAATKTIGARMFARRMWFAEQPPITYS